ncbi:MAG: hypothetical protein Q4G25_06440 [Paracoccus sp. (in: a-proteobacteria)]|nr:hypothetical protein [Paracoccus sp. (in: a-proteobacteria)]
MNAPLGYLDMRRMVGRLRSSNYDISTTCNLRCEGCLFFSGAGDEAHQSETDPARWDGFFAAEARRGINYAYLGGAEASLTPERIAACHTHIPMGVIFTNGTKRIAPEVSYRIHVSVWGDETTSRLYRGGEGNMRALRNYQGDARAVFVLTLNALNLGEVDRVARACRDHGVRLTFSIFSPTLDYGARMVAGGRTDYFRFSGAGEADMRLRPEGLARARAVMMKAAADYPGTVRIAPDYIDWITGQGLYDLDAQGVARDCGNRLTRWHRHFNADMSENAGKCCTPNLDCRDCRAYAMGMASYLARKKLRRADPENWLAVWQHWASLFLPLDALNPREAV